MVTTSQIKSWIGSYNRNFDQLCQALMWQLASAFGTVRSTPPSAIAAYRTEAAAGRINGGAAPAGSFVYWDIGAYGHVGYVLADGAIFMGSSHLQERWGINAGISSRGFYEGRTGARFLGWSWQNGGNTVPLTGGGPASGGSTPISNAGYGLSSAAQKAAQGALKRLGLYSGPEDGVFGAASVRGFQQHLKNIGLLPGSYAVDGVPGPAYGRAIQELAKRHGYTGVVDGVPGAQTSAAIVRWAATVKAPAAPAPKPSTPAAPKPTPVPATSFGIDIATTQRDIDLVKAKSEGVQFVIVKFGGLNVSPQYVSPHYRAQIDRAIVAGLPKGHYYVPGNKTTPVQQADFFVDNLHRFDKAHDVLALDNEPLDSNAVYWRQDEALAFLTRVQQRTGIAWNRLWLYAPASLTRAHGPWNKITDKGVRIWWAAYGSGPTGKTPDHTPALDGKIARWDIHQYSSSVRVAGYSLDGNFSRHSVNELFALAGTPSTPAAPKPAPREKDKDMPTSKVQTVKYPAKAPRDLKAGTWYNIHLNDKLDTSFASGNVFYSTVVRVGLEGLPVGATARLRCVRTKVGTNDVRANQYPVEVDGTSGGSFFGSSNVGELNKDDGIRWQIAVDKPAKLTYSEVRTLIWQK